MITMERSLTTGAVSSAVFAYLADFTTTTQWDPGTIETTRISGGGGIGTQYRNVSRFAGRESELIYRVEDVTAGRMISLRGENSAVVAHDRITVIPTHGATRVTYRAQFEFRGALRWCTFLLRPAVRRLVDRAADGLQQALDRL